MIGKQTRIETPIEAELRKRCEKDTSLKYYSKYTEMLNYLCEEKYDYIRDANPWYNDHGYNHVKAILSTMSTMLSKCLIANNERRKETQEAPTQKFFLSTEDLFTLLTACIWHDVAMIEARKNHGPGLFNLRNDIDRFINDKDWTSHIIDIASAHSNKDKFHQCAPYNRVSCKSIQSKLLAAILRFADEISEDKNRATDNKEVFAKVQGKVNEIYWRHTLSIKYSEYSYDGRRVNIEYEIDEGVAFSKFIFDENEPDKKQSLIEFIINRIKKVNDERILCDPFFSALCPVAEININIKFFSSSSDGFRERYIHEISDVLVSSYPYLTDNKEQFNAFLKAYPQLDFIEIEKEVTRKRGDK